MLQILYLIQQTYNVKSAMRYSIGLSIICFLILIIFWLPDMLKNK